MSAAAPTTPTRAEYERTPKRNLSTDKWHQVMRAVTSFTSFIQARPPAGFDFFLPEVGKIIEAPRIARYSVERIVPVRGTPLTSIVAGEALWRIETAGTFPLPDAPLIGATGHLVYTDAATRAELARISTGETDPVAVLIPICKSSDWWSLAQDARQAYLDGRKSSGHVAIGRAHAERIYRRLYHSRYIPGSEWDFLTYFEFAEHDTGRFEELLSALRDPTQNPEWAYVEREAEIWMTRVSAG